MASPHVTYEYIGGKYIKKYFEIKKKNLYSYFPSLCVLCTYIHMTLFDFIYL